MKITKVMTPENASAIRAEVRSVLSSPEPPDAVLVSVQSGVYDPEAFRFAAEDCSAVTHVIYQAEPGTVIHGGITVGREAWQTPDADMLARIPSEARPHVRMIPLTAYGLTREDWGEEVPIGAYQQSFRYDRAPVGCGSEFFCGNRRMIKARYPNLGSYGRLEAIADVGEAYEFPPQNFHPERGELRNLRGGCYIVDADTADRMKRWQDPSTAWMFGYFFFDWADSSTPITVKPENREIYPDFVSCYGARPGGTYYLYNVPEELDAEGEWYLDRGTGNLYFWPWDGAEDADFSFAEEPLIRCDTTRNMTFSGFTLRCGVGSAILATGEDMVFEHFCIRNIRDTAVVLDGKNLVIRNSELGYLGGKGIALGGGDRATLTCGGNRAENNYIHDFGEINQTYHPGISISGVGHTAAHNEICNAPHSAILYAGNLHCIEYNEIHDVVLLSSDAGAIYSGRDSLAYGTVIRYNRIRRCGSGEFRPQGIYWDDALNGQTAYGNILIDVGNWGVEVGGGRDHVVENNIIVRTAGAALEYDQRLRDGMMVPRGWYSHGDMHIAQFRSLELSAEPWVSRYPRLSRVVVDINADPDHADAFFNPSYSSVRNNVAIEAGKLYEVGDAVYRFSDVTDNVLYAAASEAGWDEEAGNLSSDSPVFHALPGFRAIPAENIGIFR
ncbi:MAG: right-handed parallel beta-helix repeat-containing protein [Ruminococcaceae bacterium]|nr:right-handed parallel beta-helix repeat-containing protein [Oscillospiraceae bacterium]